MSMMLKQALFLWATWIVVVLGGAWLLANDPHDGLHHKGAKDGPQQHGDSD